MHFVNERLSYMAKNKIQVEVTYALPEWQRLITIQIEEGSTIEQAIRQSGILESFPEINLTSQKVGVFSKPRALTDIIHDGDRIEIYRSLTIDPKEARRAKAKGAAKKR